MPIRVTAHVPERAAQVRIMEDGEPLLIGRDPACDLHVDHASVSRRHALLECGAGQWRLRDQGSKNGIRAEGRTLECVVLDARRWLQLGDIYLECEPLTEAEALSIRQHDRQRRHDSVILEQQLQSAVGVDPVIERGLRSLLQLAECERGFILLLDEGELRLHACQGLEERELAEPRFLGSVGSVQRALQERRSIVCHDTHSTPWLSARESVIAGGIRALVSVPLQAAGQLLGAVYMDSQQAGRVFSDLDLELIEAFADRLSMAIDVAGMRDELARMDAELNPVDTPAHHAWGDLTAGHGLRQE